MCVFSSGGKGNELIQSIVGSLTTTYNYDGNGNLTGNSHGQQLFYNAKNQMTALTPSLGAIQTHFTYAGADQTERTQEQSTNSFNQTTTTAFENTALGVSCQTISCSPSCGNTVSTYYTRDNRGALLSQRFSNGAQTQYFLLDGQGSVVGVTDYLGVLVATYQYDPYGQVTSKTGSASSAWQFQSGYQESAGVSSYLKFGARYNDASLGRWTQHDPVAGSLGDTGASNRYVRVRDESENDQTVMPPVWRRV